MDVEATIFSGTQVLNRRRYYYQSDAVVDFRAIVKATPHPIAMLVTEGALRRLYVTGPRKGAHLIREWYEVEDMAALSQLWVYPLLPDLLHPTHQHHKETNRAHA